ncbi:MAG: TRAP transporter substrate-binding protein DctP [Treponema sp.]|nr:TRAP transporter substrate-binding protein DctP [Treponema sp.]
MKKRSMLIIVLILFTAGLVFAQRGGRAQDTIEVRLGSPLPRNSDWGRTLDRIAGEWGRVTNGEVRLRVIHDGLEGGDTKMLSSLNSNNIQAALLTSTGLSEICPPVMTVSAPFLIRNNEEFDVVLRDVLPVLEEQMSRSNFVVIAWSKAGWVYIFSREPVFTPDDLRRQKMGTAPELKDVNTAFRTMGFNLVEVDMIDLGNKMSSNEINAIYLMPEAISPLGLHRHLRNYLDMPIAPFIGAIVMNRVTWNNISTRNQQELIRVTQRIASEFDAQMLRTTVNAVASMQRDGLTVNRPSPQQQELWRSDMNRATPLLLGSTYDRNLYNRINRLLENYRNR